MKKKTDNKNQSELHQAAKCGDRARVKQLLAEGAQADSRDDEGNTPLMLAAENGRRDVIADLFAAGADVNAKNNEGETALHNAAENSRDEVLADLISAGADVNTADSGGISPLDLSAASDSPVCISVLVKSDADLERADNKGWTPLHSAAYFGHPAAARALIKHGANVNAANAEGHTALHLACVAPDDSDSDFIPVVASINAHAVAEALVEGGADVNAANENGAAALHFAAENGYAEVVETLLKAGANSALKTKEGNTALRLAQARGKRDATEVLINADKNADAADAPSECAAQRVYDRVWQSVVFIGVPGSGGGTGSGVIVAPNVVATNYHVVETGDGRIIVVRARENGINEAKERRIDCGDAFTAEIIATDEKQDFCLLFVSGLGGEKMRARAFHTLHVGEEVFAIGNPKKNDLSLSAGVISQLRTESGRREIQTDAAISPGSSGGGLFDKNGNLAGITASGMSEEKGVENINFAVPADLLWGYSLPTPESQAA